MLDLPSYVFIHFPPHVFHSPRLIPPVAFTWFIHFHKFPFPSFLDFQTSVDNRCMESQLTSEKQWTSFSRQGHRRPWMGNSWWIDRNHQHQSSQLLPQRTIHRNLSRPSFTRPYLQTVDNSLETKTATCMIIRSTSTESAEISSEEHAVGFIVNTRT